jgi:hypothetical protein
MRSTTKLIALGKPESLDSAKEIATNFPEEATNLRPIRNAVIAVIARNSCAGLSSEALAKEEQRQERAYTFRNPRSAFRN